MFLSLLQPELGKVQLLSWLYTLSNVYFDYMAGIATWFFYSPISLPEARPCHLIEVYPSFLLCNGLPRWFEAFPHFVKLPNKGFILVDTFTAQNIRLKTVTEDLLSKCRLEMKTSFDFFPPAWGRLRLWQLTHKVNKFSHSISEKHTLVRLFLAEWNQWSQGLPNVTKNPEYVSHHSLFLARNANKSLNFIHARQIDHSLA